MGGVRRSKRQVAAALEKSLDMYNFEDDIMNGDNPKLSFPSFNSASKTKNKSGQAVESVQKSHIRDSQREIVQKNGKGHFLHLSKSPSFEFFSKKQSKFRKSDSGIFMTPSPILKDLSNISNCPIDKTRSSVKSGSSSPRQLCNARKEPVLKAQPRLQGTQIGKELPEQKTIQSKKETINPKEKKDTKGNMPKGNKRKSVSFDQQQVDCGSDDVVESKVKPSKKTTIKDKVKSGEKVEVKLKRMTIDATERTTRSSLQDSRASERQSAGRKAAKLPFHSQKLRSVKTRQSIARQDVLRKPTTLYNSKAKVVKQHINITRMVEESNRKHRIMTAPTSTPINLRPRTPKGVNGSSIVVTATIPMNLPEVSPVIKCGGSHHGAVVASPGNLSGLGSPQLKSNVSTRSKVKPSEAKSKVEGKKPPKLSTKKSEAASGSLMKYVCKKETAKRKHTASNDVGPQKKKVATKSPPPVKNQADENEQLELSMNLFEYSPVKEAVPKKKSPGIKVSPVEVDSTYSSLDISKTYNTDSFAQTRGGKYKKKAGRYSTTRLDQWAEIKNSEFDQLGSYELSIE